MLLKITPDEPPGTFRLEGEADMSTEDLLLSTLEEARRNGHPIVLDLSGLTFLDSSGLRVFLRVAASLDPAQPLVLRSLTPSVRRVFDLSLPGGVPGIRIED
ncbi:MAG TPA: STAS domain-containing protein [Actinomycetota bacterium]|jgi:anti-sigma B factor antagonist